MKKKFHLSCFRLFLAGTMYIYDEMKKGVRTYTHSLFP